MREISAPYIPDVTSRIQSETPHKNRFSVSRTAGTMPIYKPEGLKASYAADQMPETPEAKIGSATPSFKDLIDVINPLQHIPVVSTIYRKVTGDEISAPARVIGGAVFGGPVGGALALADVAIKEQTGTTVGEKALNLVSSNTKNNSIAETAIEAPHKHRTEPSRMAGSMPIWQNAAPSTRFEALLAGITAENNHIS